MRDRKTPLIPELLVLPNVPTTLRARWKVVAAGAAAGLLCGVGLAMAMPTNYNAMATVKIGAGIVPAGVVNNDSTVAVTEAQVATLQPQLESIARELDTSADVVASSLTVGERAGTSLIDFTYAAPTPQLAEKGAEVAADVYMKEALESATDKINDRIDLLRKEVAKAAPADKPGIESDLRNLQLTVVDYGRIVRDAEGSAKRSVLNPMIYIGIGLVGGTIFGILLALLIEAFRPRVRTGARIPNLPTFGHLDHSMEPADAARMLLPAIVRGGSEGLALVPLGVQADGMAEMLTRTIPGVTWLDPTQRAELFRASARGQLVALVPEGATVTELRSLLATFAIIEVPVLGLITVDLRALDMAEQVLAAERIDPPRRMAELEEGAQPDDEGQIADEDQAVDGDESSSFNLVSSGGAAR